MLPAPVMEQAREEFLDWHGRGISVIEMSHRSQDFLSIAEQSEADLRDLLVVPDNYKVLFTHGGAASQFAMVPQNLLSKENIADYIYTGIWSGKAIDEARRHGSINIAASSEAEDFLAIPDRGQWQLSDNPAYVYYAANETITGVEFHSVPDVGEIPLVSDMTSNFLSQPLDVSRFGVIFASAQKNVGPAGLVVVIVREDLIGKAQANVPALYDYANLAGSNSMYNTPPVFNWYMAGLVFKWVKEQGGVEKMAENSSKRSAKLYAAIDTSDFFSNPVSPEFRSRMNVPFILAQESLNKKFLHEAEANGLLALKGHRSVGGLRASLYNAMPEQGVDALIDFMMDFERRYS